MEDLKSQIIDKFTKEINSLDLSSNETILTLKYNAIVENILNTIIVKKEKINIPFHQTTNDNNLEHTFDNTFGLCAGKSADTVLSSNTTPRLSSNTQRMDSQTKESTTIPNNFSLTYEMKQFAQSKFLQNIEDIFEDFKLYYQSKSTTNTDWEPVWKRWVLNQNKYKKHLVKTTIDENISLDNDMMITAKKHIDKENITLEFTKFRNHYIANGDLKVSWGNVWENWCINHKQFKPKVPREQTAKQKEKADYKWDFRKAKDISDKIKDWLEFDAKINWMEEYYWKDIRQFEIKTNDGILKLAWTKMPHPDFNKDEILLFKVDTDEAKYLLNNENIDTVEVIEND
ncbi:hypothetical protein OAR97_01175 [Arcobacteraceae bacterium]|nr:hypothetical protein [Arcobacteraceae bacterium]